MPKPIDMGKQRNPGNTPMTPSHSHFACLQVDVGAMELLKTGQCSCKCFQGVEKGAFYAQWGWRLSINGCTASLGPTFVVSANGHFKVTVILPDFGRGRGRTRAPGSETMALRSGCKSGSSRRQDSTHLRAKIRGKRRRIADRS
jgi:hypothetical protein